MDLILRVFSDDDVTEAFQVGTSPSHPRPFLHFPEQYSESQVDLIRGSARIGRYNVRVSDPEFDWSTETLRTGVDQSERFLTALLGDDAGYSLLNGRRARLEFVDGSLLIDGVVAESVLSESFAGFEFPIEDIGARSIEVPVFSRTGTSTVFPRGVLNGYGLLPDGALLVPPVAPAKGTFRLATSGVDGILTLENGGGSDRSVARDLLERGWALTDAMQEATRPAWSNELDGNVLANVEVRWRYASGPAVWQTLTNMPVRAFRMSSASRAVKTEARVLVPSDVVDEETGNAPVKAIQLSATPAVGLPTNGSQVEIILVFVGLPSEQYPFHYEGSAGELLRNALRGDYSYRRNDGTWEAIDPRIRYDDSYLTGANAPAALKVPVRMRVFEPADSLRDWIQEASRLLGIGPALDYEGRVAPVGQQLPDEAVILPEINDSVAKPFAAWNHSSEDSITEIRGTYYRDFLVPATEDPDGRRSTGDGIGTVEQSVTVRPNDPTIQQVMGARPFELDGFLFRALGGEDGAPISGDVMDESGARHMYRRGHELIDRLAFGGQRNVRTVSKADAGMNALRVGDWALDACSWDPNYQTGRRGRNHLVQIEAVRDLNDAWRELRILDAAPYANPVGQPTIGGISSDAAGVISVAVTSISTGAEARVDYAVSPVAPGTTSELWTYLGRTATTGTLTSPALPAGSTVWIRARGEKEGRRPSAWTNPVSIASTPTPRILSASLSVSAGSAVVSWSNNAVTQGVRVYYAAHGHSANPTAFSSIDIAASQGSVTLPIAVVQGQQITVDVEPWTGWTGSEVSGVDGEKVRRYAIPPYIPADPSLAVHPEIVGKTSETVTVRLTAGPDVEDIFVWNQLIELPQVGSRRPTNIADRDTVLQPGDEYVIQIPAQGFIRVVQFYGYSATGANGDGAELEVGPAMESAPWFEYVNALPGGSAITSDVELRVRDPQGLGGELRIWSNKSGSIDPDPVAVPFPDSTIELVSTPVTVGAAAWAALDEIVVHPGRGKTIFLEFVNSLGVSSGIRSEYLHSWSTIVDPTDALRVFSVGTSQLIDFEVTQSKHALRSIGQYQIALSGIARENAQAKFVNAALLDDNILDLTNFSRVVLPSAIAPSRLAVNELSEIAPGAGIILSGELRNAAGSRYIKLDATGHTPFIAHDKFTLYADGDAAFGGTLTATTLVSGKIIASGNLANGSVDDPLIIADGTVRFNHIDAGEVRAVHLEATLAITVGKQIRSANYSPGAAGWAIHGDGTAELSNAVVRGTVYASAGEILGDLVTGNIRNVANTAGVAVTGSVPGTWGHYLNLNGSGDLIHSEVGGDLKFRVDFNGNVYVKGHIEALSGTFAGTVTSSQLTASTINATGGDLIIGSTSGTHLRALSGAYGVRASNGNVLANMSSSGSDAIFSAPSGSMTVFAASSITISSGGLISLVAPSGINFPDTFSGTAGALVGYLAIQVNGTARKIPLHAVS